MRRSIRAIAAALTVALILPAVVLAAWPVANRHSYISQAFTTEPSSGRHRHARGHAGRADQSGRVVFAGWKRNCGGYQVWVSHGNGLYSAYYHLRSESVSKGQ